MFRSPPTAPLRLGTRREPLSRRVPGGVRRLRGGFEEWLLAERRRLDETLHGILRRLLDHYVVTGAIDRAIQVALRLIALDPLQESVHRALIRLYMYQDRVGAALDQYRRCRDVLERELGVPPDAETERLRAELSKLLPDGHAGTTRRCARPTTCPSASRC